MLSKDVFRDLSLSVASLLINKKLAFLRLPPATLLSNFLNESPKKIQDLRQAKGNQAKAKPNI